MGQQAHLEASKTPRHHFPAAVLDALHSACKAPRNPLSAAVLKSPLLAPDKETVGQHLAAFEAHHLVVALVRSGRISEDEWTRTVVHAKQSAAFVQSRVTSCFKNVPL